MSTRVSQGYTVAETMIFLAVTSALFVMVLAGFQGRQASTEFSVATREMESRIKDIINDVDTGYYGGTENVSCTTTDKGLIFTETPDGESRGSNGDCMFLGKAIQFGVKDDKRVYNVFSIAGARVQWGSDPPKLVDNYNKTRAAPIKSATQQMQYPSGLEYGGMRSFQYGKKAVVAFLSPLNQYLGKRNTGSLNIEQVATLPAYDTAGEYAVDEEKALELIEGIGASNDQLAYDRMNPFVELCLEGDAVDRHVIYRIGNAQRLGEVEVIIGEGSCGTDFTA